MIDGGSKTGRYLDPGLVRRLTLRLTHLGYTLHFKYILEEGLAMQVSKWGNSLAIRLPAAVVEALELKEGDDIEIHVADQRSFGVTRRPGRAELLQRLRAFRGRLPDDFKFDREEANAR